MLKMNLEFIKPTPEDRISWFVDIPIPKPQMQLVLVLVVRRILQYVCVCACPLILTDSAGLIQFAF